MGTDYLPSQAELNKNYLQGAYTLSLLPGEDVYHNKMEDLLQEVRKIIIKLKLNLINQQFTMNNSLFMILKYYNSIFLEYFEFFIHSENQLPYIIIMQNVKMGIFSIFFK